jgi:hypothetical protein
VSLLELRRKAEQEKASASPTGKQLSALPHYY